MRYWILLLVVLIINNNYAAKVGANIFEEKNFDSESIPMINYDLIVDCNKGTIENTIFSQDSDPIEGAYAYLKYHDYSSPLLSSGTTDEHGLVIHNLPGNISLMDGMFILVMEKTGYRKKEVHFDIVSCFGLEDTVPEEPEVPEPIDENETIEDDTDAQPVPPVEEETKDNESDKTIVDDKSGDEVKEPVDEIPEKETKGCALPIAILLALGLFVCGERI